MKSIYILGAGGFAKEVYGLILDIGEFKIEAFIDKDGFKDITMGRTNVPVISEKDFLAKELPSETCLAIGVGDSKLINLLVENFKNYNFPNLIHPKAHINLAYCSLGSGNIITVGVVFTSNITVGSYNVFNLNTTIGHDVVIGNCNIFNPSVNISGGVIIDSQNLFGVGSTVLQNLRVGNNNIIGASTLIHRNMVINNSTIVGIPGKIIK